MPPFRKAKLDPPEIRAVELAERIAMRCPDCGRTERCETCGHRLDPWKGDY